MLSKERRFSTTDFLLIKKTKPQKTYTDIGVFCVYKELKESKFAIIMTKKVFKTAVLRNKYKRSFFNLIKEEKIDTSTKGLCLIFYPSKIFNKEDLKKVLLSVL